MAVQTHGNRQPIVVDGSSSDATLALLAERREQLAVLVSERDGGIYEALNKGLVRPTGQVVGFFLHADDLYGEARVLARIATALAGQFAGVVQNPNEEVDKDPGRLEVRGYWFSEQ